MSSDYQPSIVQASIEKRIYCTSFSRPLVSSSPRGWLWWRNSAALLFRRTHSNDRRGHLDCNGFHCTVAPWSGLDYAVSTASLVAPAAHTCRTLCMHPFGMQLRLLESSTYMRQVEEYFRGELRYVLLTVEIEWLLNLMSRLMWWWISFEEEVEFKVWVTWWESAKGAVFVLTVGWVGWEGARLLA